MLGDGEGVRLVCGPTLLVNGGVCPSSIAGFPSLLLAFFMRWSDRADSCFDVDGCGFAGGFSGSPFFFCLFSVFVCNKGGGFPFSPLCRFLL